MNCDYDCGCTNNEKTWFSFSSIRSPGTFFRNRLEGLHSWVINRVNGRFGKTGAFRPSRTGCVARPLRNAELINFRPSCCWLQPSLMLSQLWLCFDIHGQLELVELSCFLPSCRSKFGILMLNCFIVKMRSPMHREWLSGGVVILLERWIVVWLLGVFRGRSWLWSGHNAAPEGSLPERAEVRHGQPTKIEYNRFSKIQLSHVFDNILWNEGLRLYLTSMMVNSLFSFPVRTFTSSILGTLKES